MRDITQETFAVSSVCNLCRSIWWLACMHTCVSLNSQRMKGTSHTIMSGHLLDLSGHSIVSWPSQFLFNGEKNVCESVSTTGSGTSVKALQKCGKYTGQKQECPYVRTARPKLGSGTGTMRLTRLMGLLWKHDESYIVHCPAYLKSASYANLHTRALLASYLHNAWLPFALLPRKDWTAAAFTASCMPHPCHCLPKWWRPQRRKWSSPHTGPSSLTSPECTFPPCTSGCPHAPSPVCDSKLLTAVLAEQV